MNRLIAAQLTADVQARIFDEQFPNTILYVADVRTSNQNFAIWRNVFLADVSPAEQRQTGTKMEVDGPRITIAKQAFAIPDIRITASNSALSERAFTRSAKTS